MIQLAQARNRNAVGKRIRAHFEDPEVADAIENNFAEIFSARIKNRKSEEAMVRLGRFLETG